jgi:D-alanine-D-alanine ligase
VLIRPKSKGSAFFDYTAKYARNGADELCPAPIPPDRYRTVQELSLTVHRYLGLSGYSRTDFILCDDGSLTLLEVNTLPGMTPTSLVPREAVAHGISFEGLLERLIVLGLERKR